LIIENLLKKINKNYFFSKVMGNPADKYYKKIILKIHGRRTLL